MSQFESSVWNGAPDRILSADEQAVLLAQVRCVIHERARRFEYFSASLFVDPAWDILLQLYAAELSQQQATVAQLAESTTVPSTITARWLIMLEGEQLVSRSVDRDACRVFAALTSKGVAAMNAYFLRDQ